MTHKRLERWIGPFIISLVIVGPAVTHAACAPSTATIQTDPAVIAQRAIQVVRILDLVVDSVTAARDAGWISPPVTRTVELAIQKALPVIKATPDGAKATAIEALHLAAVTVGSEPVRRYLTWGITAIGALP